MKGHVQDILNRTDPDGIDAVGYPGDSHETTQVDRPEQAPIPCTLGATEDSLERTIDLLKRAFPRMQVAGFKADCPSWPEQLPTFGSRWQLAKVFVSKFVILNPGPGEHLVKNRIDAYGYTFVENNQRLKEIGSHLLASVASMSIMKRTEDFSAPVMAAAINKLRQKDILATLAYLYGLDELLLTGTTSDGRPREPDNAMLADCFLALVTAVHQDNGWRTMSDWLEDLILPILSLVLESQDVKHSYDKNQEYALSAKRVEALNAPSPSARPSASSPPNLPASPGTPLNPPTTPKAQTQKSRQAEFDTWLQLYAPGEKARFAFQQNTSWSVDVYAGERLLAVASAPSKLEAESKGIDLALTALEKDLDTVVGKEKEGHKHENGKCGEGEGERKREAGEGDEKDPKIKREEGGVKKRRERDEESEEKEAKKVKMEAGCSEEGVYETLERIQARRIARSLKRASGC
ncbi:hypothetical protein TWF281_002489 [Arthrobotrys megalospora]